MALSAQGWRVVAPHLRGMGPDAADPPVTSMDDFAADIVDLLDALGIEDAVFGGLSLGGYVLFALLRRAPAYVRGLILADTRPQADAPAAREGRQRMIDTARREGPEAIAAEMLPRLLGETTRRERPHVIERVASLVRGNTGEAIAGALTAMMGRPDSTDLLGGLRCPTLIVVGSEDTLTPPSVSEQMAAAIPDAILNVIDQSGHLPNVERPDAFNDAVAGFLARRL